LRLPALLRLATGCGSGSKSTPSRHQHVILAWLSATALVMVMAVACGRAPNESTVASSPDATATQATSSAQNPGPNLAPGDCVASAKGQRTAPLGAQQITLQIPDGWRDTGDYSQSETLLLQLTAPLSYGSNQVVFQLHSLIGPRQGSSSHREAQLNRDQLSQAVFTDAIGRSFQNPNPVIPSQVSECPLGGEAAAFFDFTVQGRLGEAPQAQDPRALEYWIYVLHHPNQQFPLLYVVQIYGVGGIDQQSMNDVKSMLGSWMWGQ
jgi:hypothetical protein